jgi:hypothetical protein
LFFYFFRQIETGKEVSRALVFILSFGLLIAVADEATREDSAAIEQLAPQKPDQQAAALKPGALSPYLIEWFIDLNENADLREVWRLLKVEPPPETPIKCRGCTAETFELETADEARRKTVALKISFEAGYYYQYLIFRQSDPDRNKDDWKFLGGVESPLQQYGPPKHRIETGDGRTWFVVRELWGRGSGMIAYGDVWYEIKEGKVERAVAYPVEGHNIPCLSALGRSYKTILLRHELENGVYTIPVQFIVSYNISHCDKGNDSPPLFAKNQKAYFMWDSAKEKFVLDVSRSDITEAEIETVYNNEELSHEEFVEYNFDDLLKLARGTDLKKKEWLKQFLTGLKESRLKTALQQALP